MDVELILVEARRHWQASQESKKTLLEVIIVLFKLLRFSHIFALSELEDGTDNFFLLMAVITEKIRGICDVFERVSAVFLMFLLYNSQYCERETSPIRIPVSIDTATALLGLIESTKDDSDFHELPSVVACLMSTSAIVFVAHEGPQYLYQDRFGDPLLSVLDRSISFFLEQDIRLQRPDVSSVIHHVDKLNRAGLVSSQVLGEELATPITLVSNIAQRVENILARPTQNPGSYEQLLRSRKKKSRALYTALRSYEHVAPIPPSPPAGDRADRSGGASGSAAITQETVNSETNDTINPPQSATPKTVVAETVEVSVPRKRGRPLGSRDSRKRKPPKSKRRN